MPWCQSEWNLSPLPTSKLDIVSVFVPSLLLKQFRFANTYGGYDQQSLLQLVTPRSQEKRRSCRVSLLARSTHLLISHEEIPSRESGEPHSGFLSQSLKRISTSYFFPLVTPPDQS